MTTTRVAAVAESRCWRDNEHYIATPPSPVGGHESSREIRSRNVIADVTQIIYFNDLFIIIQLRQSRQTSSRTYWISLVAAYRLLKMFILVSLSDAIIVMKAVLLHKSYCSARICNIWSVRLMNEIEWRNESRTRLSQNGMGTCTHYGFELAKQNYQSF